MIIISEKNLKIRLQAIYLILYGSIACYYPFLAVYFSDRGLSYVQMGYAFALNSLVSIISQPFWGYISDKLWNKKKTLLITLLISAATVWAFVLAKTFGTVFSSIILFVFFQGPVLAICDAYCYEIIDDHKGIQFGKIRFWGSIGFAVIALLLGKVIELTNIQNIFYAFSILLLSGAVVIYGIEFKGTTGDARPKPKDIFSIFKNYQFVVFTLSVMVLYISLGANGSYIAMLIEKTGGNVANLGFVWFAQALSEIPAFYFVGKLLKKYGDLNVYILALLLYILRFWLLSQTHSYITVILIQLMQGITFPLYLVAVMQYVNKIIPGQLRASGIAILSSLGFGFGNFLGNLGGGYILQANSIFTLYKFLSAFCILALVIAAFLKLTHKKYSAFYTD